MRRFTFSPFPELGHFNIRRKFDFFGSISAALEIGRYMSLPLPSSQQPFSAESENSVSFSQPDQTISLHNCMLPHINDELSEFSRRNRGGMILLGKYKLPMNANHYVNPLYHPLEYRWRPPQELIDALMKGEDLIQFNHNKNQPVSSTGFISFVKNTGEICCGNYAGFDHNFMVPVEDKAYWGKLVETNECDNSIKAVAQLQSESDATLCSFISHRLYFLGQLAVKLGNNSWLYQSYNTDLVKKITDDLSVSTRTEVQFTPIENGRAIIRYGCEEKTITDKEAWVIASQHRSSHYEQVCFNDKKGTLSLPPIDLKKPLIHHKLASTAIPTPEEDKKRYAKMRQIEMIYADAQFTPTVQMVEAKQLEIATAFEQLTPETLEHFRRRRFRPQLPMELEEKMKTHAFGMPHETQTPDQIERKFTTLLEGLDLPRAVNSACSFHSSTRGFFSAGMTRAEYEDLQKKIERRGAGL